MAGAIRERLVNFGGCRSEYVRTYEYSLRHTLAPPHTCPPPTTYTYAVPERQPVVFFFFFFLSFVPFPFAISGIDRARRPRERLPGPRPLPQAQGGLFGWLLRFEVETFLLEEVVDLLGVEEGTGGVG